MTYEPPFLPEERKDDETLQDRIARARKAREDAAARVAERYANIKPDERSWRTREPLKIPSEPLRVL
ncbi:MAG: hypothetical protein OXD37_07780 [Acidimicrobiaceae bacterium]|nr:hypothetical protein [Acidimicrobiaceae bacterium]